MFCRNAEGRAEADLIEALTSGAMKVRTGEGGLQTFGSPRDIHAI